MDFKEKKVFDAAKRCGLRHAPWMGDWFVSWSPRNDNTNAEGSWHHWVNLAAYILSHPATEVVAPDLYRPELKPDPSLYNAGNSLTDEQIAQLFQLPSNALLSRPAAPGDGQED